MLDSGKLGKKINNRGFTLVELLAVIAILSIISVIVVYGATSLVNKAKEEGYKVTINNVEKAAEGYVLEYQRDMFWYSDEDDENDQQYQCITVQNLIDTGYFKKDLLESEISEDRTVQASDSIYILIDGSTKTIIKNVLIYDESEYMSLCSLPDLIGDILIEVPSGWAKEKDVAITYKLSSKVGINAGYKYNYLQDSDSSVKKENIQFNNLKELEEFKVIKNGYLRANIVDEDGTIIVSKSFFVDNIDNEGPVIISNYAGDDSVHDDIIIPIKVTDAASGVDEDSFTLSDLNISVGGNPITDDITLVKVDTNNYNLKIINHNYDGEVKITIDRDMIFDIVGNGNDETELLPGVSFTNKFKISYDPNGGSGSMNYTECEYGGSCTLRTNTFTRTGYTFLGWSTNKNATTVMYNDGYRFDSYSNTNGITLYAIWRINTITIQYNVNGGSITTASNSNGKWTVNSGGTILKNGSVYTNSVNYGSNLSSSGLADYNNSNNINVSKVGYIGKSGAEWKCMSGCSTSGKTYSQSTTYNANDFCDATSGDCAVILGVNWTPKVLTVTFKDGSGSMLTQTFMYGASGNKFGYNTDGSLKWITSGQFGTLDKDGYTLLGWSTSSSATSAEYSIYSDVSNSFIDSNYPSITLYAVWKVNTVNIKYNVDGGSIATASNSNGKWTVNSSGTILKNGSVYKESFNYGSSLGSNGLADYNNFSNINVSRVGYVGKSSAEWKCMSGCTTTRTTYNQSSIYSVNSFCDATDGDCTVELGVNWTPKVLTITFNKNDGSGSTLTQTFTYGVSGNKFGYNTNGTAKWGTSGQFGTWDINGRTLLGWSTSSSATSAEYNIYSDVSDSFIDSNYPSITLYAVWKVNTVNIKYNVNGGSIATTSNSGGTWSKGLVDGNVYRNGSVYIESVNYGSSLGSNGLANYNNTSYINISKTGYEGKSGAEWKCMSGCSTSGKTYSQDVKYSASDFCNAKDGDCTVVLGVNWTGSTYTVSYEANIFSPLDTSRTIKSGSTATSDSMLDINYDHITSNLILETKMKTSRLNNLLLGLNPLKFNSGDQYKITLTYVSGTISGGTVGFAVGVSKSSASMTANTTLNLPTSGSVTSTIKITSSYNGFLKQWMVSSNAENIVFDNYTVNVVIKKMADGLTQEFVYGDSVYNVPDNLSVPVKLGYESITSWRLLNGSTWSSTITDGTPITIAANHVVYAKLQPKTLVIYYDGNGKDVGLTNVKTSYVYDSLSGEDVIDEVTLESYTGGDSSFDGWHFKMQPFGEDGVTLWFGCTDTKVSDTANGFEAEMCTGHSNPTIGWYTAEEIEANGAYYRRGAVTGGINMSNFLGYDATAVAQWK